MAATSSPPVVEPRAPVSDAPPTPATEAASKAATDKIMAEQLSSPPQTPTPTQDEADAIKTGEYDPSAPEGARVKRRAMELDPATQRYPTR